MVVATAAGGSCDGRFDMRGFIFLLVLFYYDGARLFMGSFSEHGPQPPAKKGGLPGVYRNSHEGDLFMIWKGIFRRHFL